MGIMDWFRRKDTRPVGAASGGGAYAERKSRGDPPRRTSRELLAIVSRNPVLQTAIRVRAEAVAGVPARLYRAKGVKNPTQRWDGLRAGFAQRQPLIRELVSSSDLEEVYDHPFLKLMAKPNPTMTGRSFWHLWSRLMDLNGENLVVRDGIMGPERPTAMWLYPSHWCTSTATYKDPTFKFLNGAWSTTIPEEKVWWPRVHDPLDPQGRGVGMAEAIAHELEISEYAAQAVKASMYNRGLPDFLLSVKGLDDDSRDALEGMFEGKYRSPLARGRHAFLNEEIKVEKLSHSMVETGALEIREQTRDFILSHAGVPRELIGITNDGNRATAENAQDRLHIGCTLPMCEFRRTELQEFILCDFGEEFILDYTSPLREDKQFRLEAMKATPGNFCVDEWREMAGYTALEGQKGTVFCVPGNVTPVADISEAPAAVALPALPAAEEPARKAPVLMLTGAQAKQ